MQFGKRYSFVLEFRNIAPGPVSLVLVSEDAELCLSKDEGGLRVENGEDGYQLGQFSLRKDGLEIQPVKEKNDLTIRMGLTVAEDAESVCFELSDLEEGVLFLDLGGTWQRSKGGEIQFSLSD